MSGISPVQAQAAVQAEVTSQLTGGGRVNPSQVSASVRQRANSDGDGKTGAAALNDGDSAARAAAAQVKAASRGGVDVRV